MAQKKQSEIINRLIAETKLAVLQLNKNTTAIKNKVDTTIYNTAIAGKQDTLNGGQIFGAGGEGGVNDATSIKKVFSDVAAYNTVFNSLAGTLTVAHKGGAGISFRASGKPAISVTAAGENPRIIDLPNLTYLPQLVVNGVNVAEKVINSGITADKVALIDALSSGGLYLGETSVSSTASASDILTKLNTDYPAAKAGDHVEVIKAGAGAGDIVYTTYTKNDTTWTAGADKTTHIKGGTVDAYTRAEADGRFAPLADVSMDDASILALESIIITS